MLKRKPTEEETLEIGELSIRINNWLFNCGIIFGQAMFCFMISLGAYFLNDERLIIVRDALQTTATGLLLLMVTIGMKMYRDSLKDKLNDKIREINGEIYDNEDF